MHFQKGSSWWKRGTNPLATFIVPCSTLSTLLQFNLNTDSTSRKTCVFLQVAFRLFSFCCFLRLIQRFFPPFSTMCCLLIIHYVTWQHKRHPHTQTQTSARPSSLSSSICCRQLVIMKSIIKEKSILLITCCLYLAAVWCVFCVRACIIIYLTLSLKVHWLKMMKKKIRSWKQKQLLYNDQAADSNSS